MIIYYSAERADHNYYYSDQLLSDREPEKVKETMNLSEKILEHNKALYEEGSLCFGNFVMNIVEEKK